MHRPVPKLGLLLSLFTLSLAVAQELGPPTPPAEALNACTGRSVGASCTFQHDGRTVTGTCRPGPQGGPIACAPPHGHRGPPPEALAACKDQQDGASCQFTDPRGELVAGLCRSGPRGEPPACAPKDAPRR